MSWTDIKNYVFWILLVAFGLACYAYQHEQDQKRAAKQHEQRISKANAAQPIVKTYALANGEITVLQIPYTESWMPDLMEVQRCFIWRDALGATAMACPHMPSITTD
jgi:hypothetical protein